MNCSFLAKTNLFQGITEQEISGLIGCLDSREKSYKKGEIILHCGDKVTEIGLILKGSVNAVMTFYQGTSSIFAHIESGRIFAEVYAALPGKELNFDVIAAEDCEILFLNMNRLLEPCEKQCEFHRQIIRNLLKIFASKNFRLSARMIHTAPKSIRDRLISYLSEQSLENGGNTFKIPFSRQQLADYLGVDRSALSNELSKMKKEGLLDYHKNEFEIHLSLP